MPTNQSHWRTFLCRCCLVMLLATGLPIVLNGQDGSTESRHHLGIKVQSYRPAAWLAQRFGIVERAPFMPGYWEGEAEWGCATRQTIQLRVGIWRSFSPTDVDPIYPTSIIRAGQSIGLAWRKYLLAGTHRAFSGLYCAPSVQGLRFIRAWQRLGTRDRSLVTKTWMLSVGSAIGWQQRLGGHFLLDASIGAALGYQWYAGENYWRNDQVSSLDYSKVTVWQEDGEAPARRVGLGWTASLAVGWVVF